MSFVADIFRIINLAGTQGSWLGYRLSIVKDIDFRVYPSGKMF